LQHAGRIWAIDTSPRAPWAVTACEDGTARLWDLDTGRALGPPLLHDDEVRCAVVAGNGRWLVTAAMDEKARVFNAPQRMTGPASSFVLWTQVLTGAELDDSGGVRLLGPAQWSERKQRLEALGAASDQ
jgi:WD40 repeat protein